MNKIKRIIKIKESGLLIINVVIILTLALSFPNFTSRANIFGMLYGLSVNTIILGAMTILFISGGFDISVGSTLGFCGMVVGYLIINLGMPIYLAIILTILTGIAIGSFIGYLVSYIGINPFMVTLAIWFILLSGILLINNGSNLVGYPKEFAIIADYRIFGIPMIIIFALITIIIFSILVSQNAYFRQSYFIGGNESAAKLAGIKIKRVKLLNYTLTSAMAAIAGIFISSRFMGSYVDTGSDNAFQVITAVIIGGGSLKGGKGTVIGSFLGLIFMSLIYNSLIMFRVDILWNKISIGGFLILAVLIDRQINKDRTINIK